MGNQKSQGKRRWLARKNQKPERGKSRKKTKGGKTKGQHEVVMVEGVISKRRQTYSRSWHTIDTGNSLSHTKEGANYKKGVIEKAPRANRNSMRRTGETCIGEDETELRRSGGRKEWEREYTHSAIQDLYNLSYKSCSFEKQ